VVADPQDGRVHKHDVRYISLTQETAVDWQSSTCHPRTIIASKDHSDLGDIVCCSYTFQWLDFADVNFMFGVCEQWCRKGGSSDYSHVS
jgi:hypothetical protein